MDSVEKKSQRFRSVAYPSYTIRESFDLVKRINQQFGNSNFNTREDIAQELDMSVGNLLMKLSTATQYSLLEMKSKEGYKPSAIFTSIYKPLSDEEKRKAEIECLRSPEIYKKLIDHYTGKQLPAIGGLSILLYRSYKVSEDASAKAAKIFLENLDDLEMVDSENRLRESFSDEPIQVEVLENDKHTDAAYVTDTPRKQISNQITVTDISSEVVSTAPPIPIFLKGQGRIAKLLLPVDFDNADLDYIIKVIGAHKRPE